MHLQNPSDTTAYRVNIQISNSDFRFAFMCLKTMCTYLAVFVSELNLANQFRENDFSNLSPFVRSESYVPMSFTRSSWAQGFSWGLHEARLSFCMLDIPASDEIYLRDGSAQTIVLAVTLRQKLQTRLPISLSSILFYAVSFHCSK